MSKEISFPETPKQGTPIAFAALITGCLLWGSGLAVGKIALREYHPMFLVTIRMVLAFLVQAHPHFFKTGFRASGPAHHLRPGGLFRV